MKDNFNSKKPQESNIWEVMKARADLKKDMKRKQIHEIKTRLRLMRSAKGIQQAWAEYKKIQQPAWAEYEKIQQPALAEYKKIINKLHQEQCGCKEWNGKEIVFK